VDKEYREISAKGRNNSNNNKNKILQLRRDAEEFFEISLSLLALSQGNTKP
jgi:hypothetical protein